MLEAYKSKTTLAQSNSVTLPTTLREALPSQSRVQGAEIAEIRSTSPLKIAPPIQKCLERGDEKEDAPDLEDDQQKGSGNASANAFKSASAARKNAKDEESSSMKGGQVQWTSRTNTFNVE